jgi:hypothetical protein
MASGRGHHPPYLAVELTGQHFDRAVRRGRPACAVGERALADAPRDEGAERENEQRRNGFAAQSN